MEIVAYNRANGFAYAINGQSGLLAAISLENLAAGSSVARLRGTDIDVKALVEAADSSFRYGDMTSVAISPGQRHPGRRPSGGGVQRRRPGWPCSPVMPTAPSPLKGLVETGVQPDMVTFADNDTGPHRRRGRAPGRGTATGSPTPEARSPWWTCLLSPVRWWALTPLTAGGNELAASGVVLKKGVNPSTDLEPEYIAVSGGKAYITLQENNAIAVLDLTSRTFDGIYSAGFEDYGVTPRRHRQEGRRLRSQDLRRPHGHPDARCHRRLPGGGQNLSGHRPTRGTPGSGGTRIWAPFTSMRTSGTSVTRA